MDMSDDLLEIDIRELRGRFKALVERARAGETFVITDRGVPLAQLVPPEGAATIERLLEAGLVQRPTGRRRRPSSKPLIPMKGSVSELVIEQRR